MVEKNNMSHNVYFFRDITVWCGCTWFENDVFLQLDMRDLHAPILSIESELCILEIKKILLKNTCTSFATLPSGTAVLCVKKKFS